VAIPHATLSSLNSIHALLYLDRDGLEFESTDNKPVQLVCLLFLPQENPIAQVKLLKEAASLFTNPNLYKQIIPMNSATDVLSEILANET